MRAGSSPVRCTIARATMAPSSSTGTPFNAPPYAPTGVRSGETIAARFIALPLNVLHESTVASARHMQHFATDKTRALTGKKSHGVGDIVGMSGTRSEEHTSELQSLMRISYAVFCLKKKNTTL